MSAGKKYRVVRFYQDDDLDTLVIKRGLTQAEAQAWCQNPDTSSSTATAARAVAHTKKFGAWFDGWTEE